MARARKGGAIQSKIAALIWGEQGTGKSTLALQSMYLKRPDGKDFRVLYIDCESGSVDDYADNLWEDGLKEDNLYIVYSQSLSEVREYIRRAANREPFTNWTITMKRQIGLFWMRMEKCSTLI